MNKLIVYSLGAVAAISLIFNISSFTGAKSQHEQKPYIMIDVYEVPAMDDFGVHIHHGNGKTEYVPFKPMVAHNIDDNGEILLGVINKFHAEGYEIVSTSAGLGDKSGMITRIFMGKKDK
jgi:hypothetical protein